MLKCCNEILTYKKADPSEEIQVGDIVMLDTSTAYITRAVINNPYESLLSSKLVVGVCIESNNAAEMLRVIDGGSSSDSLQRIELNGGTSKDVETILIESGSSDNEAREIIKVAYTGEHLVNICGYVSLGDKLCISQHPGKARSMDYLNIDYFESRSIGKVIKYTANKNQVKVLLDIE